jgi:hypothetical protein
MTGKACRCLMPSCARITRNTSAHTRCRPYLESDGPAVTFELSCFIHVIHKLARFENWKCG